MTRLAELNRNTKIKVFDIESGENNMSFHSIPFDTPKLDHAFEYIFSHHKLKNLLLRDIKILIIDVNVIKGAGDNFYATYSKNRSSSAPILVSPDGEIDTSPNGGNPYPYSYIVKFNLISNLPVSFHPDPSDSLWIAGDEDRDTPNPDNPIEKSCNLGSDHYSENLWQFKTPAIVSKTELDLFYGNYRGRCDQDINENCQPQSFDFHLYIAHHYKLNILYDLRSYCLEKSPNIPNADPMVKNGDGSSPNLLKKMRTTLRHEFIIHGSMNNVHR